MSIPLQEHGGMFLAQCTMNEWPGHELVGLVDSGAAVTMVARSVCERARLKCTGMYHKVGCIHGESHTNTRVRTYHCTIVVGGKTGPGLVYELGVGVEINGISIDAILGHDVLKYFDVRLNWKGGFGSIE